MNSTDSLLSLLSIFKKWFKAIFIVCTLVVIGTVVITLNMDNYFKSTTIFYAASSDLSKPSPIGGFEVDMDYYGIDADVDRILSIAKSMELSSKMIEEFNLADHYEINTNTDKGKYKVYQRFNKLYKANKNKFDAIEISVEDKDAELAAKMANRARDLVSEYAQRLVKGSQDLIIDKYENNISSKEIELDSLNNKIEEVKTEYGIYDTENQGQVLAELLASTQNRTIFVNAKAELFKESALQDSIDYYSSLKNSINKQLKSIRGQINSFNKGISKVVTLEQEQEEFGLQLSLDKERLKQLRSAKDSRFSAIHLVENADTPLVKSRPKRSILVIGAAMISFFFCLLAALIAEKLRSINWKSL